MRLSGGLNSLASGLAFILNMSAFDCC